MKIKKISTYTTNSDIPRNRAGHQVTITNILAMKFVFAKKKKNIKESIVDMIILVSSGFQILCLDA